PAAFGDFDEPSVLQGLPAGLVRAVRPDSVGTPLAHPVEHGLLPLVQGLVHGASRRSLGALPQRRCPLDLREFGAAWGLPHSDERSWKARLRRGQSLMVLMRNGLGSEGFSKPSVELGVPYGRAVQVIVAARGHEGRASR